MQAIKDKIFIQKISTPTFTEAGLSIPEGARERPTTATVLSIGSLVRDVKKGDTVLIRKDSGTPINDFHVITEAEVLGIIQ